MNFFEQELRRLIKDCTVISKPTFAGRSCYGDLGGDNRVKLTFVELGHAEHYVALQVKILNRTEGEVDMLLFRFEDVWGTRQVTNPNFRDGVVPYIWSYACKSEWYVYMPTDNDMKLLAAKIEDYLNVFKVCAKEPDEGAGD